MGANDSDDIPQNTGLDQVTQEKIREFCYELALALRRITGKVVESPMEGLPVDVGVKQSDDTTEKTA